MAEKWDKYERDQKPVMAQIDAFVDNPLWRQFCKYIETQYRTEPTLEYSGCSAIRGWNIKYKKAGRSLCTLYPMEGYFLVLVVIGNREKTAFDIAYPSLTPYTRQLYETTKDKNGLCWLVFEVGDAAVLEDVKICIRLRRQEQKTVR